MIMERVSGGHVFRGHAGRARLAAATAVALWLAGCATPSAPPSAPRGGAPAAKPAAGAPQVPLPTSRRGGYYGDDGPPDVVPPGLADTPDAVPRAEPPHPRANRPYVVFGREYVPTARPGGQRERGVASWYGRKFHGQPTSSGEPYDMFGMTAAHPTLPIPSYVRVTHLGNGRSAVVRVNDRGPFLHGRLIDLSFAAATKLGYAQVGSAEVEMEVLAPEGEGFALVAASDPGVPSGAASAPAPARPVAPAVARARNAGAVATAVGTPQPMAPVIAPPPRLVVEDLGGRPGDASTRSVDTASVADAPGSADRVASASSVGASSGTAVVGRGPAAVEPRAAASGTHLQLGAFASRANAESARQRIGALLGWLAVPLDVVERDGMARLLAGPFPSSAAAREAAGRIGQATGSRPFVVAR